MGVEDGPVHVRSPEICLLWVVQLIIVIMAGLSTRSLQPSTLMSSLLGVSGFVFT